MAILDGNKEKPIHSQFVNDYKGIKSLCKWLKEQGSTHENTLVCLEHTGMYGKLIIKYLMVDNFSLWVEMSLKIIRSIGVHNEWKSPKINCQVMKYLEVKIARNSITQKVEDNINTFLNCDDIISSWKDKFLLK